MPEDTPVEETLEESEKQRREEIAELRTLIEFSPEEAPAFEEALQQVEERKAEVTAAAQARKDETQTVKELDLEGLLYKVQTGRESLSQGRVVAGYGSPEDILATHAKDLGLSLTEYKDRLAKYEIGWEGMTSDVAHLGKLLWNRCRRAREHCPGGGGFLCRCDYSCPSPHGRPEGG